MRVGFESASCMEIKGFCSATWPSKELKSKELELLVPPNCRGRTRLSAPDL